jgi:hypothetical protein
LGPPKFRQTGIFGLKRKHLATQLLKSLFWFIFEGLGMAIWYLVASPFDVFYGNLVHFVVLGTYFPILVCCSETNLATLDLLTRSADLKSFSAMANLIELNLKTRAHIVGKIFYELKFLSGKAARHFSQPCSRGWQL